VINSVTFLGSHDAGLAIRDRSALVKTGGKLFTKEWDLSYSDLLAA
jgi:hypothetical protein